MPWPPSSGELLISTASSSPGPSTRSPSTYPPLPAPEATTPSAGSMASLLAKFSTPENWLTGSPACAPETVAECLLLLRHVFPTCQLAPEVAWHFLRDLTDAQLREATVLIIQSLSEVYPSTPWIAVLRTARQRFCRVCHGSGKTESETGYDMRCQGCRRRDVV